MRESHPSSLPLVDAKNIVQEFIVRRRGNRLLRAVSDVSLEIRQGETLGLVGESGSGKTTFARALMQAPRPRAGSVHFRGSDLTQLSGRRLLEMRRQMQLVFQDPFGSLDPRWTVERIVEEPLIGYRIGSRAQRQSRISEVLELVGLPRAAYGRRLPRELSGGQCQRVAVARALTLDPALLICDEAVSALDVLIQAQLLNLFERLRAQHGLSYLFISHDLALVSQISDRVAVLHLGQLCEVGPAAVLYREPLHPYTAMLIAAMPSSRLSPRRPLPAGEILRRELPSPLDPPSGCRFRTRCPRAQSVCASGVPPLREAAADHFVACHFPERTRDAVA
jgi:oligopeptide/dipeptide ABC transporter ATP-binding protein